MLRKFISILAISLSVPLLTQPNLALSSNAHKKPSFHAKITHRGVIDCFPKGLRRKKKNKPVYCESSAVLFDGTQLIIGSDKKIPGKQRSAVFRIPFKTTQRHLSTAHQTYWTPFKKGKKYEDFSISPDRKYGFATTGFDRIKKNGKWDRYNRLFYWKIGSQQIHLFPSSKRNPNTGKIPLRERISRVLHNTEFPQGVPYAKIEGLAAIPGNRLLFGIREWGASYYAFQYSIKLIAISYKITPNGLSLNDDAKLIYDFSARSNKRLRRKVALSSLEFNPFTQQLYLLTSFEDSPTPKGLGAYLWKISLPQLQQNKPASLALNPQGKPLLFAHKAEAITVIDKNTLLIFHDDDRVLGHKNFKDKTTEFYRQAHQAAYTFVSITP